MSTETQINDTRETAEMLALVSANTLLYAMEQQAEVNSEAGALKGIPGICNYKVNGRVLQVQHQLGRGAFLYTLISGYDEPWPELRGEVEVDRDYAVSCIAAHKVEQVGK